MEERFFVGSFNRDENDEGLVLCSLDSDTGALSRLKGFNVGRNPSFATPVGRDRLLVITMEGDLGEDTGEVSLLAIHAPDENEEVRLDVLSRLPTGGAGPCHVAVDAGGTTCGVANYAGGSVSFFEIRDRDRLEPLGFSAHEGSSVHPKRQQKPHAHGVTFSLRGDHAFVCDLGTDEIVHYAIVRSAGGDRVERAGAVALPGGSGPRHLMLHSALGVAYVINELSSTVAVLAYDPDVPTFELRHEVSLLPEGFDGGNTAAELVLSHDGRTLYGSNRGHDSLAVFSVDQTVGELVPRGHASSVGRKPWDFSLDPTGRYLVCANHGSNSLAVLTAAPEGEDLRPVEQTEPSVEIVRPSCIAFVR
jgi:6-phosphogluconolactonase